MSDLRHALRLLVTQPGLTGPVVLALALGIGVNTTIFGFVDGLLFRPLPVERLDEVRAAKQPVVKYGFEQHPNLDAERRPVAVEAPKGA